MWQKCPVCNGTGLVSRPPWVAGDVPSWSSTGTGPYPCRVCGGKGVLLAPDEHHATDPPRIELAVPPIECEELKARAERAEAKLRNLAETAAWRAECLEAVDYCLKQRNTCIYINNTSKSFWERWNRSYRHSTKLFEQAEADYRAALKAALGEQHENP